MHNRTIPAVLASCFAVASVFPASASAALNISLTANHVPGEMVVKMKSSPTRALQLQVLSTLQKALGEASVLDLRPLHTDPSLQTIKLADPHALGQALEALQANDAVEFAEPNYLFHAFDDGAPNDPDFSKTWGLANTGQTDAAGQVGTPFSDIRVLPVWAEGFRGDRKILVGVTDTGVDYRHPDLINNIYTNPGEAGELANNGKDDDGNGFIDDVNGWNFNKNNNAPLDDHGHGSHCAGTIGAEGNNALGVAGVNWQVSILPVKFLDASGGGTLEGAIEAVNYSRIMKVRVSSNSWGGNSFSQALSDAVKAASDAGVLFVAAAGNDGMSNDSAPSYPANFPYENVVSVAATDNRDQIAKFSNFGTKSVHVAAPGVKVYSTVKDGKYGTMSGTSMAAPHVSGIAALLLSTNSEWTAGDIKRRMIETSDPIHGLRRKVVARGRVNVYNALHGIIPPSTEPDESQWVTVEKAIESVHPYLPKSNETFTVNVPGAKYIRIHFEKLEMEPNYDFVSVETPAGEAVEKLSSSLTDYTTDYLQGDTAVIRLKSDSSVNRWGFKIDRVQVIM